MPKIIYDSTLKKERHLKDLSQGCYLIKDKSTLEFGVMTICQKIIHFHKPNQGITWAAQHTYNKFYDDFEIIGKIRDFTIIDLELE